MLHPILSGLARIVCSYIITFAGRDQLQNSDKYVRNNTRTLHLFCVCVCVSCHFPFRSVDRGGQQKRHLMVATTNSNTLDLANSAIHDDHIHTYLQSACNLKRYYCNKYSLCHSKLCAAYNIETIASHATAAMQLSVYKLDQTQRVPSRQYVAKCVH